MNSPTTLAIALSAALFCVTVLLLAPLFTFIGTDHLTVVCWAAAALLLALLLFGSTPPRRPRL